jgi:hypothetical protein
VSGAADWSRVIALTDEEFLASWHALELGEPPADLELSVPDTVVEAAVEYAIALDQLQQRGLVTGADDEAALHPDLTAALRALAEGTVRVELRLSDGLTVLGGPGGLLVIDDAHDPGLFLLPVPATALASTMVQLAGPFNRGWVKPVTIPADVLQQARDQVEDGDWWTLAGVLAERGVDQLAAQSLALMCTDVWSSGRLEVRAGDVHASLGFHRGGAGDYLQVRAAGAVTIEPITAPELLERLQDLLAPLLAR